MNILYNIIEQNIIKDTPPEAEIIKDAILEHINCDVLAILFYGSCLRTGNFKDNVADFYVIVSNYGKIPLLEKFIGHLLPPNVYYIEIPINNQKLRAKYGVFTLKQFKKMSSINAFQPYLWARLVQPMQLIYAKDEITKEKIIDCISIASITTLFNTLPLIKTTFNLQELWLRSFKFTYKSEVRHNI
ncbi:MAG: hypothetical protein SVN78_09910 [Deferribacterota bacterium]|nr:hypothetical protein [Deferribacterota bacterium]